MIFVYLLGKAIAPDDERACMVEYRLHRQPMRLAAQPHPMAVAALYRHYIRDAEYAAYLQRSYACWVAVLSMYHIEGLLLVQVEGFLDHIAQVLLKVCGDVGSRSLLTMTAQTVYFHPRLVGWWAAAVDADALFVFTILRDHHDLVTEIGECFGEVASVHAHARYRRKVAARDKANSHGRTL